MAGCDRLLPVVWKSNFFGTIEGFALLDGVVDVYVADLKFGNDTCARQIAGVDGYMQIVTRNLLQAAQGARLIVRHLLLPGHLECCYRPIVDWMCRHLPAVPLRIMTGYLPRWQAAGRQELASPLGREVGDPGSRTCQGKGTERDRVKEISVSLEDDSSISEINILPDGRVCLFGASQQVLEILDAIPLGDPALRSRIELSACSRRAASRGAERSLLCTERRNHEESSETVTP